MNYFGVGLCAISAIFYLFIKSETHLVHELNNETEPLLQENRNNNLSEINTTTQNSSEHFFDNLNPIVKRVLGTVLSIIAGILLALAYVPYLYVMDKYENSSQNSLDYIFSMYTGILLSSLFYFAVYCLFKKNSPYVNYRSIFPGFLNGWIWGIANCSFLFANTALSQAVTFPIAGISLNK